MPRATVCLVVKRIWSVSYTPRVGVCLVIRREGVSLTRPVLVGVSSWVGGEFSYTPSDRMCVFVRRIGGLS